MQVSLTRTGGTLLSYMLNAVKLALFVDQDLIAVFCEIFILLFRLACEFLDFSHFTAVTQLDSVD